MDPSNTDGAIDAFTLELLRTGYALTELAGDLAERLAADASQEQDAGETAVEMISGSIQSFLSEQDEAEVRRATVLIAGAAERIIEHLHLALALRKRLDGDDGKGRVYDDVPPEDPAFAEAPPLSSSSSGRADHVAAPDVLDELVRELLDCGGVLSQLIAGMVKYSASGSAPPETAPIPETAHRLVREVLTGVRRRHSKRDVTVAAKIVREATDAICSDLFFVNPEFN